MPIILAQLEGEIEDDPTIVNGDAVFHVLGVKVVVKPRAATSGRLRTPTLQRNLSLAELTATRQPPLPPSLFGLGQAGFKGATAIVVGNYVYGADQAGNPDVNSLVVDYPTTGIPDPALGLPFEYHPFLEVGPPESLLLGPLTAPFANGVLTVNGVPAIPLPNDSNDPRLIPWTPTNEFGIPVNLANVPVDTPISIDGYPGVVGGAKRFIGFKIVADSPSPGILVDTINPQVGVTRAQARIGGGAIDFEIRGGVFTGRAPIPAGSQQRIQVFGNVPGSTTPLSIGQARAGAGTNSFDGWRLRTTINPVPLVVPSTIFAIYSNSPIGEVRSLPEPLEVRDDAKTPPLP
ncbi:hypothetical protein [Paludisphaera rhizosphaerae]|uniref:hypothetical protein n=1 Tax=Paludisphaera rhizosphaerae TaxID=2711216 RepID=UPI0013EABBFC|nr:hypothetical protein [Paludisphaera rhizosphaerae]